MWKVLVSPSWTVTAHTEQGCVVCTVTFCGQGDICISISWCFLCLDSRCLYKPGCLMHCKGQTGLIFHKMPSRDTPKWQLHWAHLSDHCSSCFQLSPQDKSLITTFLCACRCYIFIHVSSKTTSSDVCQAEFPASRGKTNLRETIMCLLLLLTTWKIPFCHRTSAHHSELQQICF